MGADLTLVIGTLLSGTLLQSGDTVYVVPYVNQAGINNIIAGCEMLNDKLMNTAGEILVFGYSEGCQVAHMWLRKYGINTPLSPSRLSFLFIGNGERRYGGMCYKTEAFEQIAGTEGLPDYVPYRVTDFARQYDAFADFPTAPEIRTGLNDIGSIIEPPYNLTLFNDAIRDVAGLFQNTDEWNACINSLAGALLVHSVPGYLFVTLDDADNLWMTDPDRPLVQYGWSPTYPVPALGLGPTFPQWDSALRSSIELEYNRPVKIPDPDYSGKFPIENDSAQPITPPAVPVTGWWAPKPRPPARVVALNDGPASTVRFGTFAVDIGTTDIEFTGKASELVFGDDLEVIPGAVEVAGLGGIASQLVFSGDLYVNQIQGVLFGDGIASALQFGSDLDIEVGAVEIDGLGGNILSDIGFGNDYLKIVPGSVEIDALGGIASALRFGSFDVAQQQNIDGLGGIASELTFGTFSVEAGAVDISGLGGIASILEFGSLSIDVGDVAVTGLGNIPSSLAIGGLSSVVPGDVSVSGLGGHIASKLAFGSLEVDLSAPPLTPVAYVVTGVGNAASGTTQFNITTNATIDYEHKCAIVVGVSVASPYGIALNSNSISISDSDFQLLAYELNSGGGKPVAVWIFGALYDEAETPASSVTVQAPGSLTGAAMNCVTYENVGSFGTGYVAEDQGTLATIDTSGTPEGAINFAVMGSGINNTGFSDFSGTSRWSIAGNTSTSGATILGGDSTDPDIHATLAQSDYWAAAAVPLLPG